MKITDWVPVVPTVTNGWTFAFATLLLIVWLIVRAKR